jgi:acetyltransferase-like isoleucine patch superfamily enzyme
MTRPEERKTLMDDLQGPGEGAAARYREIFVGDNSFWFLLKYELIQMLVTPAGGAIGYLLRKIFYPKLLAKCGQKSLFGKNTVFRSPGRIELGNEVVIDDAVVLDAKGDDSAIRIGNCSFLGGNVKLSCSSSRITIGHDVSIGPDSFIRAGLGDITLGSNCTVGAQTIIISGNPSYERLDIPMKKQVGSGKGVTIGDDIWIGVGVRIIDGVHIGNGSVIGAGSVVIGDIPDYAIVAGVPAKVIGSRKNKPNT